MIDPRVPGLDRRTLRPQDVCWWATKRRQSAPVITVALMRVEGCVPETASQTANRNRWSHAVELGLTLAEVSFIEHFKLNQIYSPNRKAAKVAPTSVTKRKKYTKTYTQIKGEQDSTMYNLQYILLYIYMYLFFVYIFFSNIYICHFLMNKVVCIL